MGTDVDGFAGEKCEGNCRIDLVDSNGIGPQAWCSSQELILAYRRPMPQALAVVAALLPMVPLSLGVGQLSTTVASTAHCSHEIFTSLAVTSS